MEPERAAAAQPGRGRGGGGGGGSWSPWEDQSIAEMVSGALCRAGVPRDIIWEKPNVEVMGWAGVAARWCGGTVCCPALGGTGVPYGAWDGASLRTQCWGGGCAAVGVSPPRDVLGTPTGVLVALGLWALTSPWP